MMAGRDAVPAGVADTSTYRAAPRDAERAHDDAISVWDP